MLRNDYLLVVKHSLRWESDRLVKREDTMSGGEDPHGFEETADLSILDQVIASRVPYPQSNHCAS
jgi:hypothetical protein